MAPERQQLSKTPTGIEGLDEITNGGLPSGRTTLICGFTGSGKTVLGMEFLVHGILDFDEPGVFVAFEETEKDLSQNVASFGYDLDRFQSEGKLALDCVHIDRSETEETGDYDLEALFLRIGSAVDSVKAKRVVLDTIEVLFSGLRNQAIIRAELRRLFRWLKDRGLTAIVTGERGDGTLTRYGLEEYVADCVILLDHRLTDQISTRRLRIVKYRGSVHGTDEYPFLLGEDGMSVLPISSVGLTHKASGERVLTGVPELDEMFGGGGFFRGSSILVSGSSGTGKSSLAITFLKAACERGERTLYFGFEESRDQVIRNMKSIGIDLKPWVDKSLFHFETIRPSNLGIEAHLAAIHRVVKEVDPQVVAIDPLSNFIIVSDFRGVRSMLTRLVDFLKMKQITTLFTHLAPSGGKSESTVASISSIMDTWLLLRDTEHGGRRSYALYVLKARGIAHSHELREFKLTDDGVRLGGLYTRRSPADDARSPAELNPMENSTPTGR